MSRLSAAFALTCAASAYAAPLTVTVPGTGDLTCQAYFHNPEGRITYPLVLSLKGTGVYTTSSSSQVELAVRRLYEEKRVTVLTLDKPGVAAGRHGRAEVNDSLYNRYVQDDLVRCAANALAFAEETAGAGPVLVSGHSEGAQVAVRLLADLTETGDARGQRIRALFLSGLPLGDWRALLGAQLGVPERDRFFTAFARRDDAVLRSFGNLSAAYLGHVFAQEPLDATLERLRRRGSDAALHIYQGLTDRNTPAAAVRAFEARNRRPDGLKVHAHYYAAGHALNRVAIMDIARDIAASVAGPGLASASAVSHGVEADDDATRTRSR